MASTEAPSRVRNTKGKAGRGDSGWVRVRAWSWIGLWVGRRGCWMDSWALLGLCMG